VLPAIGSMLCVAGIALAIWARLHLGRNWSPAPALKEGHELVTSGPYRLVRHPIYTGILTALLGSSLVSIAALIALVVVGAMFIWRVGAEEKLMMQQFPNEYPQYKRNTRALIPYVW
jgi:protein-S-isoprenylcysteine O-methyltransferase